MSDNVRGLPVRTEEDPDLKLQNKIVDFIDPTKGMEVDNDKNAHVEIHGNKPNGDDVVMVLSEEGRPNSNGDYDITVNSKPASTALIMHDRKDTAELPSETDQNLRTTGIVYDNGIDETVVCQDVAIRDESGVPYSKNNPMPVALEESEGDEIHDYLESVDVILSGGTAVHSYVVPDGKTFLLDQILCDGSLAHSMLLEIGDGAVAEVFAKVTKRFASEANDNADVFFKRPKKVIGTVNGTTVKVTVENRDKHNNVSIYSTIVGLLHNT